MRSCTPTPSAPSATGRQSGESQKTQACPKAGPNRSRHRYADPRRAAGRCALKRFFSLDRARPVSLLARPKGAPAAPRAVGRGGARERAQFSLQAETELSGLCDDDNGGCICQPSAWLISRVQWDAPPIPPAGAAKRTGPSPLSGGQGPCNGRFTSSHAAPSCASRDPGSPCASAGSWG